jgi:hypothetical protein
MIQSQVAVAIRVYTIEPLIRFDNDAQIRRWRVPHQHEPPLGTLHLLVLVTGN